jgi:membrane complex biogenesis BtpA family protein
MSCLDIFPLEKPIIGVVHLLPLPGSPKYADDIDAIIERAEREANILCNAGVDGLIVENYNDEPFSLAEPTSEQIALMASITTIIRRMVTIPLGVNVHFNAWRAEIALAYACQAQFVRIEVFVDTVVTAAGIVEPCSSKVTRYRKEIGASGIALWADLHPKFSHNLLPTSLPESAQMARNAMADAVIVTGQATGLTTPIEDIQSVKEAIDLPVLAGSGTTIENVQSVLSTADGAIVGSAFKEGGNVYNTVTRDAVTSFLNAARR